MGEYEDIRALARRTGEALLAAGRIVSTAESCTGGWIAKALTDVAGSSSWFACGLVTYSNEAKQRLLGVAAESLEKRGAVSEVVVREMAAGAMAAGDADLSVAVSGIAGPDGGCPDKPVGTVWFAWAVRAEDDGGVETFAECRLFHGDREAVRRQTVCHALNGVLERVSSR